MNGDYDNNNVEKAIGSFNGDELSLETRTFALDSRIPGRLRRNTFQSNGCHASHKPKGAGTTYEVGKTSKRRCRKDTPVEAKGAELDG